MTIRDFAKHLGAAVRTVAKWEAEGAKIVPLSVMQAALDTALARAGEDARVRFKVLVSGEDPEEDGTDRRDATKTIAIGAASLLPIGTLDVLERLAARPSRVDGALIAGHEEVAATLAGLYRSADPRAVLPMATAYADTVLGLLAHPMSDRHRARLGLVAVGAHAQIGLWACHAGEWANAYRHLATACDLAATTGSPSLHAQALGAFSYLFSSAPRGGRGGDPDRALALLDHAIALAGRADGFTRGWLAAWRAEQRLVLGDVHAGFADVEATERGLAATDDRTDGFFSRLTYGYGMGGHLGRLRGMTLALTRNQAESDDAFRQVLSSAANLRHQVCTHGCLGIVRVAAGEPEDACDALVRAVDLAAPAGYAMGLERVAGVRAGFDPCWSRRPCVRELDERLRLAA